MTPRGWLAVLVLMVSRPALGGVLDDGAKPDPRIEKAASDWKKRRDRISVVRYRVSGTHVYAKGMATGLADGAAGAVVPPTDLTVPLKRSLLLDFKGNRHRLETEDPEYLPETGDLWVEGQTTTFDGETFQSSRRQQKAIRGTPYVAPGAVPVDVGIATGNLAGRADFDHRWWPVFLGHGVIPVPYADHQTLRAGKLQCEPDLSMLEVYGEGVHGGRTCLIVRTRRPNLTGATPPNVGFREYWLDPAHESAVVRMTEYAGTTGTVYSDMTISHQPTSAGHLPSGWVFTLGGGDRPTRFIERFKVDGIDIDPPVEPADFTIAVRPGMLVARTAVGSSPGGEQDNRSLFRVSPSGVWEPVSFAGSVEVRATNGWPWLIGGILAFVAVAAAGIFWRRRRVARS
jgi:hypothetical protein